MIILTDKSQRILEECVSNYDIQRWNKIENFNCIPNELCETLRDIVCDELIDHGLNTDDVPTPYGLDLEQLIDELGAYMHFNKE